jgi:hypothetical protein
MIGFALAYALYWGIASDEPTPPVNCLGDPMPPGSTETCLALAPVVSSLRPVPRARR